MCALRKSITRRRKKSGFFLRVRHGPATGPDDMLETAAHILATLTYIPAHPVHILATPAHIPVHPARIPATLIHIPGNFAHILATLTHIPGNLIHILERMTCIPGISDDIPASARRK
ncbi:MAG: hypothetical protein LBK07_00800 [Tannerella sp.]|nr:hypothetical protein [Tannerella sp.]